MVYFAGSADVVKLADNEHFFREGLPGCKVKTVSLQPLSFDFRANSVSGGVLFWMHTPASPAQSGAGGTPNMRNPMYHIAPTASES